MLATPPAVTTTSPVLAPAGTVAVIEVALQFVVFAAVPLKVTLPPVPKSVPVIVTDVPTAPAAGSRLVIDGPVGVVTVKLTPSLATPLTVTTTSPVVAPAGTVAVIEVSLQLVVEAAVPLKVTLPPVPKSVPVIVTEVPTSPEGGSNRVITGFRITVKATPLLATPLTVTTTSPVSAPAGTVAVIEVSLQFVVLAAVPLKVTLPLVPKLVPVIVTAVPTVPEPGLRPVIDGAEDPVTVKLTPLLATPLTVTTTLPVVAPTGTVALIEVSLQLVVAAAVPLKVTLPLVPNLCPYIVTEVPTSPDLGFSCVIMGVVGAVTVKATPLLTSSPTVTTTSPVVAPAGTMAVIKVSLQLVVVAAVPLKVTLPPVPKRFPYIVTEVPTAPESGDNWVITGFGTIVKATPLLFSPPTVTTTSPEVTHQGTVTVIEVSLQLVVGAYNLLMWTKLLPCVAPKLLPMISNCSPTPAASGLNRVITGAAVASGTAGAPRPSRLAAAANSTALTSVFAGFALGAKVGCRSVMGASLESRHRDNLRDGIPPIPGTPDGRRMALRGTLLGRCVWPAFRSRIDNVAGLQANGEVIYTTKVCLRCGFKKEGVLRVFLRKSCPDPPRWRSVGCESGSSIEPPPDREPQVGPRPLWKGRQGRTSGNASIGGNAKNPNGPGLANRRRDCVKIRVAPGWEPVPTGMEGTRRKFSHSCLSAERPSFLTGVKFDEINPGK